MQIQYQKVQVNDQTIFYREGGNPEKPVLLLLHGFPTASYMFRNLIPLLTDKFHLIAPDLIGFGQSSTPNSKKFEYSFDHLTYYISSFLERLSIDRYYMYVFDYGAPVGFRLALHNPHHILGIVSQNGNIYEEGLGEKWSRRKDYWKHPTTDTREKLKVAFSATTIKKQYLTGEDPYLIAPDGYSLDIYYTKKADYAERQLDLIFDYQTNVQLYPKFQQYLRTYRPKLLAIWGKNDPSFIYPGAQAFKRDDPNVHIVLLDAGHFALESHYQEIAQEIKAYF